MAAIRITGGAFEHKTYIVVLNEDAGLIGSSEESAGTGVG
jgi:hypothetical protein